MKHIIAILFLACLATVAMAGPTMTLRLTDGSVITGEMLSFGDGIYRIRSQTLGLLEIPEERVATLVPPGSDAGAPAPGPDNQALAGRIGDLQQRMATDQGIMELIMQLQDDPAMQSVLTDPQVLQAIASNDLQALEANPKIQRLMDHPVIQQIFSRVK